MNSTIHVLLVEDSLTDVMLTEEALSASRFQIQNCQRLGDALKLLLEKQFDVILLDLGLPDSQGLDTLRTLRRKNPQVAVVVLTGKNDEELALQALKEGAQDYLVKGQIKADSLQRVIRYAVERSASEKMLRGSEERFRELTKHIDQVLWMIDAREAKVIYISPGYEKMWGRSCQSMLDNPRSYMEGVHPLDLDMVSRATAAMYKTGRIDEECRILRPDGSMRWVWVRGYPVTEQNQIVRIVGVIEDITEKRRLEAERDALLFRLQLHIERMPLAYVLFDAEMRIMDWNPAAERIFGYTRGEILGAAPPWEKIVSRSVWENKGEELCSRMRAGDMDVQSINENVTRDGRTITCQWFNTPLHDDNGQFVGFLSLAQDVTERHRNIELLQSVLNHTVDGIISIDERGTVSLFSKGAERIFGYPASEVVGQNVKLLMPDPYHSEHDGYLENYLQTGEAKIIGIGREVKGRKKDGSTFPMDLDVTEFELESRRFFLGIVRDISERKKLEDQLRQAQKMEAFGQLAGGVAHDFNNLLCIISGYSELLLSRLPSSDPARESIKAISEAGERAASLTRQLLAFSRKTVLEPRVLDLNAAVRETEKMLRRLLGEDILLTTVLDPQISRVKLDPGLLTQVLMNLCVNARDAIPRGGKLTLETRNVDLDEHYANTHTDVRAGQYVMVAVSDTGCGMTPETQARIFEPFFTTKGVGKGTGLGLSVVHGIVKQSEGHIEVYSELKVGTTFKLYFPAALRQVVNVKIHAESDNVRGTETILIVEDEDSVRALALLILQMQGYKVLAVSNGKKALQLVEKHQGPIDLLVTDVVMPGMGGGELAEALKPQYPKMKVLFISGYTDDAVVRHGILQAEVSFLQKPFSPQALAKKVRQVLDEI